MQFASGEADCMADAARMVADAGARRIDINMGGPAKKVVGGLAGSALMRALDQALALVVAVSGAVKVPVTVKMRLGRDDATLTAPQSARRAEAAGVSMITVHGWTRCAFYSGAADWAALRHVTAAVRVPVTVNGDIALPEDAARAVTDPGADGAMVGRGARGAPWLPAEIAAARFGAPTPRIPRGRALADMVAETYEAMLSFYGRRHGLAAARKHLGWYMEGAVPPRPLHREILTAETPAAALAAAEEAAA